MATKATAETGATGRIGATARHGAVIAMLVAAAATASGAAAQAPQKPADDDALGLEIDAPKKAEPPAPAASGSVPTAAPAPAPASAPTAERRLFVEGAVGRLARRYGLDDRTTGRLSLDFRQTWRLAERTTFTFSDRVDALHPVEAGADRVVNSLREAYVSWQDEAGTTGIDAGRINLRNGPAYGFNPTDFFRTGALRVLTTADPIALRDMRLGTVMVRAQRLWTGGGASLALAPKLASAPSDEGWSVDLGATNDRHKALASVSQSFGERVSAQFLVYHEGGDGGGTQIGASATALLTDALVAHAEWAHGRERDPLRERLGLSTERRDVDRLAVGATWTLPSRTAITLEYERNGAAPRRGDVEALAANLGPVASIGAFGGYLLDAQRRQDSPARDAWLVYATQKAPFGWSGVDVTGFVRVNADDRSRFAWIEARRHWSRFDLALQAWYASGRAISEFGTIPDRRLIQLVGTYYF